MVYLIDTDRGELDRVDYNGESIPIIRKNQKIIEGSFPVVTVTDRKEVTYYVCDFIPFSKFNPKETDVLLWGAKEYDESIVEFIDKCQS